MKKMNTTARFPRMGSMPVLAVLFLGIAGIGVSTAEADQMQMYWTNSEHGIRRADLDGTNVETVLSVEDMGEPYGIGLDMAGGQVYSLNISPPAIWRVNLDGTGAEELLAFDGNRGAAGFALDVAGGKMYWVEVRSNLVRRANLDGTGVEDLLVTNQPLDVALDAANDLMYWTDLSGRVRRANMDGTGVTTIVTESVSLMGLALDLVGNQVYWTDRTNDRIRRANLDGTGVETVVDNTRNNPYGIALDLGAQQLYWVDEGFGVYRANLDGTGVTYLVDELDDGYDRRIVLTPEPSTFALLALGGLAVLRRR